MVDNNKPPSNILFQGSVRIYLQGNNALLPFGSINSNSMSYYIGSRRTALVIRDFRSLPLRAAQHILSGHNGIVFADIFNQQARAEVRAIDGDKHVEIDLYENPDNEDGPTLWLGVADNNQMSVQDIAWEIFRPVDKNRTAFAQLVNQS